MVTCLFIVTRNVAYARFLAQIIRLRAQFSDYTIKKVRLDNAGEFTSQTFNNYCMSIGILVEHPVVYVHTQNSSVESLIKRLQLIASPLIMKKSFLFLYGSCNFTYCGIISHQTKCIS